MKSSMACENIPEIWVVCQITGSNLLTSLLVIWHNFLIPASDQRPHFLCLILGGHSLHGFISSFVKRNVLDRRILRFLGISTFCVSMDEPQTLPPMSTLSYVSSNMGIEHHVKHNKSFLRAWKTCKKMCSIQNYQTWLH